MGLIEHLQMQSDTEKRISMRQKQFQQISDSLGDRHRRERSMVRNLLTKKGKTQANLERNARLSYENSKFHPTGRVLRLVRHMFFGARYIRIREWSKGATGLRQAFSKCFSFYHN